jgi:hypothetical protein
LPETSNPIIMLIGIFTAAWILVLLGTVLIFEYIVPLVIFHSILDGIVKGILATILVVIWLGLFIGMRNVMIRTQLRLVKKVSA